MPLPPAIRRPSRNRVLSQRPLRESFADNEGGQPANTTQAQVPKPVRTLPEQPATEQQLEKVESDMNAFERSTLRWTQATFFILAVTCIFIGFQWNEMRSGGQDTHDLAVAAKTQAEKMQSMSDAADKIRKASEDMVAQNKRVADDSEKAIEASNKQSKAVLDAT